MQENLANRDKSCIGQRAIRTRPLAPRHLQSDSDQMYIGPHLGQIVRTRHQYRLRRCLGSGGFGAVFEAECLDPDLCETEPIPEVVAIKVFSSPDEVDSIESMKREIISLLALRHPRIPRIYDYGRDCGFSFLVQHFYPNGSLHDLKSFMGPMPFEMAWRFLANLLSALRMAHASSIMHMDIKPANILVDMDGGFVLTDFGISQGRLVPWHIIRPALGTAGYASPEQRQMEEEYIDARTDLWGLGATAWSMLTGLDLSRHRDIYRGNIIGATHGFPPIRNYRPECPQDLEDVVMSLVALPLENRPGGAAEVISRIREIRGERDLSSETYATLLGSVPPEEVEKLLLGLNDPLWASVCNRAAYLKHIVRFGDGQVISREGDESYLTYVLLKGRLRIEQGRRRIATESREGTFVGEISTLTGRRRTASIIAEGDVYTCVFNAAELEKLVTCTPAVGLRLIHSMAERLARERLGPEPHGVSASLMNE